jgi:hypothetical protein
MLLNNGPFWTFVGRTYCLRDVVKVYEDLNYVGFDCIRITSGLKCICIIS